MGMKEKIKNMSIKFKEFFKTTYGMLITVSWIALIACLIMKIFGGEIFELWWDNEHFIKFCKYVDEHIALKMTVSTIIAVLTTYPIYCIMLNERKPKLRIVLILLVSLVLKCIIGWYFPSIGFILDVSILLGLMTIFNKNFKRNIICFGITCCFQVITIITRNLSFNFNETVTTIQGILYQIDYYLMILLFYLYNFKNRKAIK